MTEIVQASGIRRVYGQGHSARTALDRVHLSVEKGEFLTVFGPSGSGKSTLLSIIGTLDRDFEGTLSLFGHDVTKLHDSDLSRLRSKHVGFVFQGFNLLDHLSVLENVTVPFLFAQNAPTRTASKQIAIRALERVGLADRANDRTGELSGGQRQRVAIARSVVMKPNLLLCDEPTGNLDSETAEQIIGLFRSLHNDGGVTLVCATHDTRIAKAATRNITLRAGQLDENT